MQQPQNPDELFTYDKVGNCVTSHLTASYTHDDVNRLTQDDSYDYTYDTDGNLTSKTDRITSDTTAYTFDAENRLTRIDLSLVTVGMPVTRHPPHRSVREELPHTAPTSGQTCSRSKG